MRRVLPLVLFVALFTPAARAQPDSTVTLPSVLVGDRFYVTPVTADGDTLRFYTDTGGGLFVYADAGWPVDTVRSGGNPLVVARLPELDPRAWIPPPTSAWGEGLPVRRAGEDDGRLGVGKGMLGQAWFADRVWTFDYAGGRLLLHPDGVGPVPGGREAPLAFLTDSAGRRQVSFPRIQAVIDGDTLHFLFDTGATVSLTDEAAAALDDGEPGVRATSFITTEVFDRWRTDHPDWRVIENADRTVESMAMIEVPEVEIAGHRVGPVRFTQRPDASFHEFMARWMDRPVDGALGGNAFRFFRVMVDYPRAVAVFAPGETSSGPGGTPLEIDDIRAVRTFPSVAISPSGDRIAYVLDEHAGDGGRRADLWVGASDGGAPRRLTDRGDVRGPVRWSPDGGRIAFLAGDEPGRVWLVRPEGGPPGLVEPEVGRVRDLAWSPDGRILALVAPSSGGSANAEGIHLSEVDAARGHWLVPPERHGLAIAWSPDGRRIAFSAQPETGFYGRLESDLHVVTVDDGTVRPLVDRPGVDRDPLFSADGERVAFVSGFGETGMLTGLGVSVVDPDGGPPRDHPSTGKGSFFTGPWLVGWSPDDHGVLYTVSDGVRRPLERVSVLDGTIRRATRDSSFLWSSYSVGSGRMAFLGENGARPAELFVSALDPFRPVQVTGVNDAFHALDDVDFEVVRWTNSDGETIEGMLLTPAGREPPLPLVTILHGGPAVAVSQGFWGMEFFNPYRDDMFASRGFAVFLPNPRGSAGYGTEFMEAVRGDWGTAPADDVTTGIEHLIATGVADPGRLGLMGWSYGGYLTAWILTRTDRFAAASVGAGPVNLIAHFAQGPEQMLDYFGAPPWEDPEPYLRSSPIRFVDRIRTPTLVQHGGADTAVSPSQSEELHTALRVLGVPVELVIYEGQGHVLRDPEIQERAWRTTWEWFRTRLGP